MITKIMIPVVAFMSAPFMVHAQDNLSAGIKIENLDRSAKPGDDFYQYACGGWMKANPLPAAFSRYGSFDQLGQNNVKRVNELLGELLEKEYPKGSIEQKLSEFYKLAMDSVRRNSEGVAPTMSTIKDIESASTKDALINIQLKYAIFRYGIPLQIEFAADEKNARMNILNVSQSGLTLGQKDYYLDKDSATVKIREAYKRHIVRMFKFFGFEEKQAVQKMNSVLYFETELAKVSKSRTELRDVEKNYNKYSLIKFNNDFPNIGLTKILDAEGVKAEYCKELIVGQPFFVERVNKLFAQIQPKDLKAYMEWNVIVDAASYLSDEIAAANFNFFGKTMSGRKEDYPRWKRATNQVEAQMGEALGKMYVERYFPAAYKARMEKLVKNLQLSLAERIKAQNWMNDTTKRAALDKLNSFYVKIGYPDKWKDMSGLDITPSLSYYENVQNCRRYWNQWNINYRAGKPVDKDEWFMTPQTVNAYYNPTTNEICFPAGILQYPFFDMSADDAFNYGAIGVVIGHEMTHGFDDQGRHYDKNGNMTDWWAAADVKNFTERATKYANFFSRIEVLPGLHANGRLTLGENLADHGGLEVSFNAFKNATKDKPLEKKDGFTPEQRFFLAYAGVWASNITNEEIRNRTKSDPHSLSKWRVDGALPHIDAWYKAFSVKPTDKMYIPKNQRLELW